ncbi:MAG: hypothetical protein FWD73_15105 [Polyangiaceae bacterium]|nr:hypothetical protein [Polyangiaceae bacterium]
MRTTSILTVIGGILVLGAAAVVQSACYSSNCEGYGTCAENILSDSGITGSDVDVTPPPPICDPSADPSCLKSEKGIFVNGDTGVDSNDGSKLSPVATISQGIILAKSQLKSNVYVCASAEPYAEAVRLDTAGISLFGGFACGSSWEEVDTTQIPRVAPATNSGYPLQVGYANAPIIISDLEFDAPNATTSGASSIAIFVTNSTQGITFRRVIATAGNGANGANGAGLTSNYFSHTKGALDGAKAADGSGPGAAAKDCPCVDGSKSTGGAGGNGGGAGDITRGDPGSALWLTADGPATWPTDDPPTTGIGGSGYTEDALCNYNVSGGPNKGHNTGADADEPGAVSPDMTSPGTLDVNGWTPTAGPAGSNGNPGQGGGGGGGGSSGGGASGACGGCGGAGGNGGQGGGGSIAIASFNSSITLDTCTLTVGNGGDGGSGVVGEAGAGGGDGLANDGNNSIGCIGGNGGAGSSGGGGGGGAAGISVGIVFSGPEPQIEDATPDNPTVITIGSAGNPGNGASSPKASGCATDPPDLSDVCNPKRAPGGIVQDAIEKLDVTPSQEEGTNE